MLVDFYYKDYIIRILVQYQIEYVYKHDEKYNNVMQFEPIEILQKIDFE